MTVRNFVNFASLDVLVAVSISITQESASASALWRSFLLDENSEGLVTIT